MKLTLIFALIISSFTLLAKDDPKFAEHKSKALEHLAMQITSLETHKKCVEAATDGDGMKKCHDAQKAERVKMETQKINDDIKKLEEKKKKIEEEHK